MGVDDVLQRSRRLIPPAARCRRRDDGQVIDGLRGRAGCEQRAEHGGRRIRVTRGYTARPEPEDTAGMMTAGGALT